MMDCGGKTQAGIWFCLVISFIARLTDGTHVENNPWLLHRWKRATVTCADKYKKITVGHSACLPASDKVVPGNTGVSQDDINTIVSMHNTARREVTPTAKNMLKMSWDSEIAETAQRWAENCVISHDGGYKRYAFGRFSVGQNLAWGGRLAWHQAVQLWINERDVFSFGGNNNLAAVGHYTQIVWAETAKVGCGYAQCGTTQYYVCNYGPAGNFDINNPYLRGSSCGDCSSRCEDKLCDCGDRVCLNGGKIDLNSCACACKKNLSHFLQPDCALNCTGIVDPRYCTQFAGNCERFTNVPQECPKMCDWCPTAGKGYDDETSRAALTSPLLGTTFISAILAAFLLVSY